MNKRSENRLKFAKKMGEVPNYKPRKRAYLNENGDILNARGKNSTIVNKRGPVEGRGSFYTAPTKKVQF